MLRLRRMKGLAALMCICMILGMLPDNAYADDGSGYTGAGGAAEEIYVGGPNAAEGNEGTFDKPYATLMEAADAIYNNTAGSYNIMMLGDTTEASTVEFSYPGRGPFDVSITVAPTVTGSGITISRGSGIGSLIEVGYNATLTIEGSKDTELVFDGRNIEADSALFFIFSGILNVNAYTTIKNNNNTSGDGGGIYNGDILNINGGVITGNSCDGRGGGVFNSRSMTMDEGTISFNYSDGDGGGIYTGGIYGGYTGGTFTISDGIISNNTCAGSGSGIYNTYIMTMEGGTISNHSKDCFANSGSVTVNGGFISYNEGNVVILNYGMGTFNMTGGTISNNKSSEYTIEVYNGEFNLSGGYIINNEAEHIADVLSSSFIMTGGTISGNKADTVFNIAYSSSYSDIGFSMSSGEITNNSGKTEDSGIIIIETEVPITLSDNALISGVEGEVDIFLDNYDYEPYINVSGSLNNIEELTLDLYICKEGEKVLAGSPLTESIVSKFKIVDNNYGINNSGYTEYLGGMNVYYVNEVGDDNASGTTSEEPLRTIKGALDKIGTAPGTIILTSNIEVEEPIFISSDITIKTDGADKTIDNGIADDGWYDFLIGVIDGKLTLGDTEETTGKLIIRNDRTYEYLILSSSGELNLNHGLSIQETVVGEAIILNYDSVTNIDGASISASNNSAIYNQSGTVNFLSGTISAASEDIDDMSGIENYGTLNMSGGTINGFKGTETCGILNHSILNLSGGIINDNTFSIVNSNKLNMSQNPIIPIGDEESNGIYLIDGGKGRGTIYLEDDLELSDDNQILVYLDEYRNGNIILDGEENAVKNYHSNFILSDRNFNITERGEIKFNGEKPVYYVDADYTGDGIGTEDQPFKSLYDAVDKINSTAGVGIINIRSDIALPERGPIVIISDITILNDSSETYTISGSSSSYDMFIIPEPGSLSLGSMEEGDYDEPKLIIGDGYGSTIIKNYGELKLYSGVQLSGSESGSSTGGIDNYGTFYMYGGVIANCQGRYYGGVNNEGTFIMSGGVIENNSSDDGVAVYNKGTMHLSKDASIPMKGDRTNKLMLGELSSIYIDSDLTDSGNILLTTSRYAPGRQILKGNDVILSNNYSKFLLDVEDYRINQDGALEYLGVYAEYYVDAGENGSDSNTGSKESPFATLAKAVSEIESNGGVGVIHLCSDIEIDAGLEVNGSIKLINEDKPYTISRNSEYFDTMFRVYGQLELGQSELNDQPEKAVITINGNIDGGMASGPIISNEGNLILNNGIILEENQSNNYTAGGIHNLGSILMKGGVIQNNKTNANGAGIYNSNSGHINILRGSIRYNETAIDGYNEGGGIYNDGGTLDISGGSIHNNKSYMGGGISNSGGILNISGGSIHNNFATLGAGLYLSYGNTTMSGGEVYGNTGYDDDEFTFGSGVNITGGTFTVHSNASIASDNEVSLTDWYDPYDDSTSKSYITVGGSLSEDIPAIIVSKVKYNIESGAMEYYYPIGDQIIKPATGYTLAAHDISKFKMANSNYGINSMGKLSTGLSDDWFTLVNTDDTNYTGSEIRPGVVGMKGSTPLIEGIDYRVSYKNNINPGTASVYITGMGNYGGTVIKNFVISGSTYIITANAGDNGTIIPSGEVLVNANGSQEFTIVPATGYEIASVIVNGVNMGARSSYNFTNVTDNQTITVTFRRITSPTPPPSSGGGSSAPAPTPVPSTGSIIELDAKVSNSTRWVTTSIKTEELMDKILNNEITDVNVNITQSGTEADSRILIDPDLLNVIKDTETDIKFSVKDDDGRERYSWSFSGSEMAAMDKEISGLDISLSIQKASDNKDLSEQLELETPSEEKNQNSLVISFGHEGDLPAQASVRMYMGDMGYKEGDKLYLYYYNSETGKLDTLPYSSEYVVDSEGYITVNIIHCSEYVLVPNKASAGAITSLRNQISVTPNKVTLTLGSKNKSKATIEVNLPKTLELVKDLKDKTSGSAIGAAKVTYKSGNKKIATVDASGIITAKKAGKVEIKVTVTLYSGKTKTFKVSVTVK